MAGFRFAYDGSGHKTELIRKRYIPTATAIEEGEIVDFTPGTGVIVLAGPTDFDDPAKGVAKNAHAANSGTEIEVSESPSAVYRSDCTNVITATGGSTTTFVVSGLLPQTDDLWNGGMLKIISCAANSELNGKKIPITDCTGSSGTLTFATQPSAFASGDTAYLCPGKLAIGEYGWDLTSDATEVDWDTNGAESLELVDSDPEKMQAFFKLRLHKGAGYPKAV